ncbi:hypothetical protein ACLBKT_09255 [Erythrobacter sp. W302b]|uniref:hypothetical protein n=1 Tax=Erythrobacter sp. W302b TaxID=3389874 RepID=UPI00396B1251
MSAVIPTMPPRALIFNLNPPVIEKVAGEPIYLSFVGRAYRQPYTRGALGSPCNNAATTPFAATDLDTQSASGTLDYSYKLESNLKAGADADLVQAAVAAGLPTGAVDCVEAAAKAAYDKAKNREVTTTGQMRIVLLKQIFVDEVRMDNNPRLAACRQFLQSNPEYALMKAITVFHIGKSQSASSIATRIAADVKASVSGLDATQLAAVKAAIDSKVTEEIQTALEDRYIVWAASWLKPEDI